MAGGRTRRPAVGATDGTQVVDVGWDRNGNSRAAPVCGERRDIPERIQLGARDDRGSDTGTGLSLFRTFGKEQPDQKLHERIILKGGCFLNAKTAEKSSLSLICTRSNGKT